MQCACGTAKRGAALTCLTHWQCPCSRAMREHGGDGAFSSIARGVGSPVVVHRVGRVSWPAGLWGRWRPAYPVPGFQPNGKGMEFKRQGRQH
eukprot:7379887-Prymnesium_polylepis.2